MQMCIGTLSILLPIPPYPLLPSPISLNCPYDKYISCISMFITYIHILFLHLCKIQEPQWKHTICVCLRLLALLSMIIPSCIHFTATHVKLYLRSKKIMEFESLCISMIYYNVERCEELLNSWGSLNYF